MEANNSIESTESSVTADIFDAPVADTVETEQSVETAQADNVESTSEAEQSEPVVYEIGDKQYTLERLSQLEKGEMLQADYTRKTQEAAEVRKKAEAELAKANELNNALEKTINELKESVSSDVNKIDWDYLRENDTGEYLKQKELLSAKMAKAKKAEADLAARREQEFTQNLEIEQKKLIESQPTWVDPKQRDADIKLIEEYVTTRGFSDEEVKNLTNHKLMNAILDASRYAALQSKSKETAKSVQKAPNVVKATVKQKSQPKSRSERFYGS